MGSQPGCGCSSAAGLRVDLPQSPTMLDLDGQRRKRPGNRERIDRIKDEMDRDVLRTRIAAALQQADKEPQPFDKGPVGYEYLADAVIRELGLTEAPASWNIE